MGRPGCCKCSKRAITKALTVVRNAPWRVSGKRSGSVGGCPVCCIAIRTNPSSTSRYSGRTWSFCVTTGRHTASWLKTTSACPIGSGADFNTRMEMTSMKADGEFFQRDRMWQPPAYDEDYKTSVSRSPRFSLISLQNSMSEITGPVFGHSDIDPIDAAPPHSPGHESPQAIRAISMAATQWRRSKNRNSKPRTEGTSQTACHV